MLTLVVTSTKQFAQLEEEKTISKLRKTRKGDIYIYIYSYQLVNEHIYN